jgi:hypothetical protein
MTTFIANTVPGFISACNVREIWKHSNDNFNILQMAATIYLMFDKKYKKCQKRENLGGKQ